MAQGMRRWHCLGFLAALTTACADSGASDGSSTSDPGTTESPGTSTGAADIPATVEVVGVGQKGPLLLGSEVTITPLDASGAALGTNYGGQLDLHGAFAVAGVPSGDARIVVEGFYFDETTATLSNAPSTLRARVALDAEGQFVGVNALTHLVARRIDVLIEGGLAHGDASTQAHAELVATLGIGIPPAMPTTFEALDLFGAAKDDNLYLLAVSATLLEAAALRAGSESAPHDAQLQEILDAGAEDLAADGALSPALWAELRDAEANVDAVAVEAALQARAGELGLDVTIEGLATVLDPDDDGTASASDNCPNDANADQLDDDDDGKGDPCDPCDGPGDADADGLQDACDNCIDDANLDQKNKDGDAWGDACDACAGAAGLAEPVLGACCDPRTGNEFCQTDGIEMSKWCTRSNGQFICSSPIGSYGFGDACLASSDCNQGAPCISGFPACQGGDCCSMWCTTTGDDCPDGFSCAQYFEAKELEGIDVPFPLETLGWCAPE